MQCDEGAFTFTRALQTYVPSVLGEEMVRDNQCLSVTGRDGRINARPGCRRVVVRNVVVGQYVIKCVAIGHNVTSRTVVQAGGAVGGG
jgi:hypothetical protein